MKKLFKTYPLLFIKIVILSPIILLFLFIRIFIDLRIGKIETQRIGHMIPQTENFILEKKKKLNKNQYFIWFTDKIVCNYYILKKFGKHLIILPRQILEPINIFFSFFKSNKRFNYYYKDKISNEYVYGKKNDDLNLLKQFPSSIIFTDNEKKTGDQLLQNIGLKENNYICFATRSKKFRDEKYETNRNSNIDNLMGAVKYMVSNEMMAVRLGKKNDQKIEWDSNKIIDFSCSKKRSDFLDLYLMSKCKFMLTGGSGILYMAQLMRKKILIISFFQFDTLHHHAIDYLPMVLPKKFFSSHENKTLSYKEVFERKLTSINIKHDLKMMGYELIENTDKEIKDATTNMNNLLDKKLNHKLIRKEQEKFWNNYKNNYNFDTNELIICPTFFKNNLSLFQ